MRYAATRVIHRVYACFGSTQAGGAYFGKSCGYGGGAVIYTSPGGDRQRLGTHDPIGAAAGDDAIYKGTQTVFMSLSAIV